MKRGLWIAPSRWRGFCDRRGHGPRHSQGRRSGRRALPRRGPTPAPNWKELSGDVGVMIRDDRATPGFRGRLYVRVDGVWYPVATDGPADVHSTVPVK